jgi:hypothetical protein
VGVVELGADERVPGRPFSDPGHLADDTALLEEVRGAMGRRLRTSAAGGEWSDALGDHVLVVPHPSVERTTQAAVAVGFFGQARDGVDHERIVGLERNLLRRASGFRGLLAYHNVRLAAAHQWSNLVVFADHDAPAELARDDEHRLSVDATPAHYHSLRLHRFELPDGVLGTAPLRWVRTSYFDFDDDPIWLAVRCAG